jgi:VIT1/CCC1 family predicted Fe2+/Mn2+ transporter
MAPLGRRLVLDELFDLSLYRALQRTTAGDLQRLLGELIPIETKHLAFWQRFFGLEIHALGAGRRLKLWVLVALCHLFGDRAVHLVLEAIEIHGVRKYLEVWELYRDQPLGEAVREVLTDEFRHEDEVVSRSIARRVDPEGIRNVFLGFNDGLVEILGAVSGFFAAFEQGTSILLASLTVSVAGGFSMGAGAYVAGSSENEVRRIERGRQAFLLERSAPPPPDAEQGPGAPMRAAWVVGVSYLLGALVPVLPVAFGARTAVVSWVAGAVMTLAVSAVLAFLSGMDLRRRLWINAGVLAGAVIVTTLISLLAKRVLGVSP